MRKIWNNSVIRLSLESLGQTSAVWWRIFAIESDGYLFTSQASRSIGPWILVISVQQVNRPILIKDKTVISESDIYFAIPNLTGFHAHIAWQYIPVINIPSRHHHKDHNDLWCFRRRYFSRHQCYTEDSDCPVLFPEAKSNSDTRSCKNTQAHQGMKATLLSLVCALPRRDGRILQLKVVWQELDPPCYWCVSPTAIVHRRSPQTLSSLPTAFSESGCS